MSGYQPPPAANQFWGSSALVSPSEPYTGPGERLREKNLHLRHRDRELSLCRTGTSFPVFSDRSIALMVRGYLLPRGGAGMPALEKAALEVIRQYRESGRLPTDSLDGSFSLVL